MLLSTLEFDVAFLEVRPLGRTPRDTLTRALAPEAPGAKAHEYPSLNVGAEAPTS